MTVVEKIRNMSDDEHLTELSSVLHKAIEPGFDEYGLGIPQFYLTTVVLPEEDPNFKRIRELHTISFQTRLAHAEAQVRSAQALAEADVAAARRVAELERQTTQTEVARREAERKIIEAQAEAEAQKAAGFAQAEVMRAQGYNQRDVIQAEVQKAYAAGIGNMGSGGGGGGSTMSDIIGLGVGLQAAGAMSSQIGNIFAGMNGQQNAAQPIQQPTQQPPVQPAATAQPSDDMAAFKAKVEKLTVMKEAGMISEEEFNSMKAKLLSEIL